MSSNDAGQNCGSGCACGTGSACGGSPWIRIFTLAARGEPYRILFPLGAALGLVGVMLWPAFVMGWLPFYPGIIHARIMVQGFVFCFMAGFLGSALPHMLEVKGMSLPQTILVAVLILLVILLHLIGFSPAADAGFALIIVLLLALNLRRWPLRQDLPPPGFALAACGLISGFAGAIIVAIQPVITLSPWTYLFGKNLLHQAFILFPVLGVGAYLLPRMAGLPNRHLIPKSSTLSPAWIRRALFMVACGMILLISFAIEAAGHFRPAYTLRALIVIFCLLSEVPLFRVRRIQGSIPWALIISVISIMTGLVCIAVWPAWQKAMIHIVFISGYGLLILNIAARVILGHSGHTELIYARSTTVKWIIGLVLLAMATRVSADLLPRMQLSHYAYASITWAIVTLLWLIKFSPLLAKKDVGS